MPAAGEDVQAGAGLRFRFGFGKDAAPCGDGGVSGQHHGARYGRSFAAGDAADVIAGEFVPVRRLVDVRGYDALGNDADLSEEFATAGTGRGQNQTADG